jgi:hypothetical protein
MFRTGRDTRFGSKTLFFTIKIEIGKKFISMSAKGANKQGGSMYYFAVPMPN